ncbi:MAG: MFS transporter [Rhodospirillales bacterium]|nr:MFS transporter [Rhodospirillales bacterium]
MTGVFAFPALMPTFLADWRLSNAEAGWIAGIYFGAYALSVPVLVALTDRVDARWIYVTGALLAATASTGFALFANGFWQALILRAVAGAGLAATYMPGLRVLVDRYRGPHASRAVSLYTASFSLGTALSFLAAGAIEAVADWRWVFAASALAAAAAALMVLPLGAAAPKREDTPRRLLDFRPVFANRAAMGYILGYGVHCWELFTFRSWTVALLAFSLTVQASGSGPALLAPTTVATISAVVAMAASIFGNELCLRYGRRRVIQWVMVASAAMAFGLGFTTPLAYGIVVVLTLVYSAVVQLDSAALTAGAVHAAEPGRQGSTMAVHSLIGFGCGFVGPLVLGWILDVSGGGVSSLSWGLAFASVGVVGLLGPLVMRMTPKR